MGGGLVSKKVMRVRVMVSGANIGFEVVVILGYIM